MSEDRRDSPNVAGVDQSDRIVHVNLRQSGCTSVEMLISTLVFLPACESPLLWHFSIKTGCRRATFYNRR